MDESQKVLRKTIALFSLQLYFGQQKNPINYIMHAKPTETHKRKINLRTSANVVEGWVKSDKRGKRGDDI